MSQVSLSKTLTRALSEQLMALNSAPDHMIDPDFAVKVMEQTVATLLMMSDDEKERLSNMISRLEDEAIVDSERTFYADLNRSLGVREET